MSNSAVRAVIDDAAYSAKGWSGKDDQTVASEINTDTVAVVVDIDASKKREVAAAYGVLMALEVGKTAAPTDQLKALCYDAVAFYHSDESYVRADHKAMLDLLSASDVVIPAAFTAALDGLCDDTQTIREKEGLSFLDAGKVQKARAL